MLLFKRSLPTETGSQAETVAEKYLKKEHLKLIARNFRCQCGEIDLIMRDQDAVVFIEVRLRRSSGFASAAESVTPQKQRRVIKAANFYLQKNPALSKLPCRFDVVAIDKIDGVEHINWIQNAFEADF